MYHSRKEVKSMQKVTIRAARVNTDLTQLEMAEKLGISLSLYQDIENGVAKIKPVWLYGICHITGFSEAEIKLPEKSAKSEQEAT